VADVRCIYRIVHEDSGNCYVGQTVNLRSRKSTHLCALRAGRHHSRYLQNAFNAHGERAFVFEILERFDGTESGDDRTAREGFWMSRFRPVYNWSPETPTRSGWKDSEETKRRKAASARGNRNAAGRVADEAERAERSARMMGNKIASRIRSPEWRARQSEMMRGNGFARKANMTNSEVPRE